MKLIDSVSGRTLRVDKHRRIAHDATPWLRAVTALLALDVVLRIVELATN